MTAELFVALFMIAFLAGVLVGRGWGSTPAATKANDDYWWNDGKRPEFRDDDQP